MSNYRTGTGSDLMLDAADAVVGLPKRIGLEFELNASIR